MVKNILKEHNAELNSAFLEKKYRYNQAKTIGNPDFTRGAESHLPPYLFITIDESVCYVCLFDTRNILTEQIER